ncbi:TIGR02444 family protein [Zobellella maritima]|uniref:TIGR02444 family protein n=1 Tax=Zobellella maritima TaxID=2059725 RepID=UPI000E306A6C|nr:TIGR02444 family protein [Zobellella maritima]
MAITPTAFWQFSLRHYGKPGVARACLGLQDDHGANINLLLLLLMLEQQGLTVSLAPFNTQVSLRAPLFDRWRDLRKNLKHDLPSEQYQHLLQHELELERWQQAELLQVLAEHPAIPGTGALLAYLIQSGVADAPQWQARLAGTLQE